MRLGLIGYPLGHSWSNEIHPFLIHEAYAKWEILPEELDAFLKKREFDGINVTIPYKESVIPYLDEIDPEAEKIGAINCIVNRNGKLIGYNTDYQGLKDMLVHHDVPIQKAKVAILGSGGASKAAKAAAESLQGIPVIVSRHPKEGQISYEDLYAQQAEFSVLINTTPVGMFPKSEEVPVNLNRFAELKYVVDVVANPLRTRLQFEAFRRNIPVLSGFEMLVRQAASADERFGKPVTEQQIQACMQYLYEKKRNLVLIGMPTSGKTMVAKELSKVLHYPVHEMDEELESQFGTSIKEVFARQGEAYFRRKETELADTLKSEEHTIISCGGGIIKNEENMRFLRENGVVFWIDRNPEKLFPTDSRPLSSDEQAVKKLYAERKDLYAMYSDYRIENNREITDVIRQIIEIVEGEKNI